MKGRIPAFLGGAMGVVAAVATVGVVHEHRTAARRRDLAADPAAMLAAVPADRSRTVTTDDGIELSVEEVGPVDADLTVVFVHGYALNRDSFAFQRHALAQRFGAEIRMVFYDQRSHGRSGRATAHSSSIARLATDLNEVLLSCIPQVSAAEDPSAPRGVGPAASIVLVGHSMGGMTILALAQAHPELFAAQGDRPASVSGVALINTSAGNLRSITLGLPPMLARIGAPVFPTVIKHAGRSAALVERTRIIGREVSWAITRRLSFASPVARAVVDFANDMIAATPVDVVADFFPSLLAYDGREGLTTLTGVPVVVLGAEKDALTPAGHSVEIADALPGSSLTMVPDTGHLLMLERPEVVDGPIGDLVAAALAGSAS